MRKWVVSQSLVIFSSVLGMQPSYAQNYPVEAVFEVVTIKPTDPAFGGILIRLTGDKFSATGFTLRDLIAFAYQVDVSQILGGPKWFATDRYDVLGKPDREGPLSRDTARVMLRALLANRFQLKIHQETREMPVYVLTVNNSGPKMKQRTEGDGGEKTRLTFQGTKATGRNVTAKVLAEELGAMVLNRPVLDRTGIAGTFDLNLSWSTESGQGNGVAASVKSELNDPDLFTAIREQLGLKLEAAKGPVEIIAIDQANRPSEN